MLPWAAKRRLEYLSVIFIVILVVVGVPLFIYFYDQPSLIAQRTTIPFMSYGGHTSSLSLLGSEFL